MKVNLLLPKYNIYGIQCTYLDSVLNGAIAGAWHGTTFMLWTGAPRVLHT